jgi:hypothetical protein
VLLLLLCCCYAAAAAQVCDCIQGFAIHEGSIGVMARPDGDVSLTLPSLPTLPNFPFLAKVRAKALLLQLL